MASPFKPIIDALPAPLRNKYFLVLVLFAAKLFFFDKHDVLTQMKLNNTLNQLEQDKTYYEEQIDKAWEDKHDMEVDAERYARERYYMKKGDEDVFVIIKEGEEDKK